MARWMRWKSKPWKSNSALYIAFNFKVFPSVGCWTFANVTMWLQAKEVSFSLKHCRAQHCHGQGCTQRCRHWPLRRRMRRLHLILPPWQHGNRSNFNSILAKAWWMSGTCSSGSPKVRNMLKTTWRRSTTMPVGQKLRLPMLNFFVFKTLGRAELNRDFAVSFKKCKDLCSSHRLSM